MVSIMVFPHGLISSETSLIFIQFSTAFIIVSDTSMSVGQAEGRQSTYKYLTMNAS